MAGMDVVVIDWGADTWKVGTVRRGLPTTIPSPAGCVVGGSISDWNAFRSGLRRVFALLECLPEEVAVLVTIPPKYPQASVRQLQHVCFELGVKFVKVAESPPLALCSEGASSGLVIDIGHSKTCIAAVSEGNLVDYVTTTRLGGGHQVVEALQQRFREQYTTISPAEAVHILKEHGEVSSTPSRMSEALERSKLKLLPPVVWRRRVSEGSFDVACIVLAACEVLFHASGLNLGALAHEVVARIFAADLKAYSVLASNVILCGGVADAPGLIERLRYELRPWPKLRIARPTERKGIYKVWHGAAQLASLPDFIAQCTCISEVPPVQPILSDAPQGPLTARPPPLACPAEGFEAAPLQQEAYPMPSETQRLERQLQDLKRGVEWEKLKNESQVISFKADLELASLRTGHDVSRALKAAQQDAAQESRRQQREHTALVHAVAAAKAGSLEELQDLVGQLRSDAERARDEQAQREAVLMEALQLQVNADGSEFKRVADSVMRQAEDTRRQYAESEARMLAVIQSLMQRQQHPAPSPASLPMSGPVVPISDSGSLQDHHQPPHASAAPSVDRQAPVSAPASAPPSAPASVPHSSSPVPAPMPSVSASLAALPVHPALQAPAPQSRAVSPRRQLPLGHHPPSASPATPRKWHVVHGEDLIGARPPGTLKEMHAKPPPEDSLAGSPEQRGPVFARKHFYAGQAVSVRDTGSVEQGMVVEPYSGTNANLVGRGLWWVRINGGLKRLKPAEVLFSADEAAGGVSPRAHPEQQRTQTPFSASAAPRGFASDVRKVIDFMDADLSPRTMQTIGRVRRQGGTSAGTPSEEIVDFPSDDTESIPVQTYSPRRQRAAGGAGVHAFTLAPPSPKTVSGKSDSVNGIQPGQSQMTVPSDLPPYARHALSAW